MWRYIKNSCYFWGSVPQTGRFQCSSTEVSYFLETCSSAVRNSCDGVPTNPSLPLQAGNFPTRPAQGGVAQASENRENSPAPSVPCGYHQRIYLQSLCCTNSATCRCTIVYLPQGLNTFLFTLYKPRKHCVLCGCFVLCSYWHEGPRTDCSYWGRGTALGCWVLLFKKKNNKQPKPGAVQTEVA